MTSETERSAIAAYQVRTNGDVTQALQLLAKGAAAPDLQQAIAEHWDIILEAARRQRRSRMAALVNKR